MSVGLTEVARNTVASSEGADQREREWISVRNARRAFKDVVAIDGVNLLIPRNSRVALVGPSGCGKSTLLSMIAGLEPVDDSSISVAGATDSAGRLARCVLMPQKDLLLPWRSALDNACLPLENAGISRRVARAEAMPFFERFGLAQFEKLRPSQLSGGMRQRVAFVRTLLAKKDVLLLDEPFAALDSITRAELQGWLVDALQSEPRTVILVTHDVEEALLVCDRVAVFSRRPGRIIRDFVTDFERLPSRHETVSTDRFVHLKEKALEALE